MVNEGDGDGRAAVVIGSSAAADGVHEGLAARGWQVRRATVGAGSVDLGAGPAPSLVVLAHLGDAAASAGPLVELAPEGWDAAAEQPVRDTLLALQAAHAALPDGARVVVVLPSAATIGVPGLVPLCTAVEAIRVMGKVAARRWGARGITVNTVLVPLDAFLGAATPSGAQVPSLGQASLPGRDPLVDAVDLVELLAADASAALTGATLGADAGTVMVP